MKSVEQMLPGSGSMGPRELFIKIVLDELSDIQIDIKAVEFIEHLATAGAERLSFDSMRALEAEDNFRLFAKKIKIRALRNSNLVGTNEIESALAFLCPLFPIC
ncbi:hypothetical protein HJ093_22405 [Vibrio parahaemolyticus]|uniref:hypothetical protein n=1 Tax=Vibrio parahaemolyticus TaxID=670 RepID=UPI00186A63AB|nr:hypothetical protein [Vibrio parahaemolyticus]EJL7851816.1 hypothetical protein [Vibrio parahaemolyticus]MBE4195945.1 hypothetical protein [Vibrio parahaemolyticus]MBO0236441.1 hypothetical protein [Vibrio parahaemolyticus]